MPVEHIKRIVLMYLIVRHETNTVQKCTYYLKTIIYMYCSSGSVCAVTAYASVVGIACNKEINIIYVIPL